MGDDPKSIVPEATDARCRRPLIHPRPPALVMAALALPLLVVPSASPHKAQEQQPPQETTLRVEAPSVVVDVIVTDKKGRHVSGLTRDDFKVYEDKVAQKIVTFVPPAPAATPAGPGAAPAGAPRASEPAAGERPAATETERNARALASVRFITIVMDLGDLEPANLKRACDAAAEYLEKNVAAEDFVAIYTVDSSLHLSQPFTQDKQRAIEAVRRVGRRVPSGRFTALQRIETQEEIEQILAARAKAQPASGGAAAESQMQARQLATLLKFLWSATTLQSRAVFVALRAIAQAYADIPGRKNVVVFSQGFMHSPEAKPALQAVIDSANRANVAFYVIDASGLATDHYNAESAVPPDAGGTREANAMGSLTVDEAFAMGLDKFDWSAHVGLNVLHEDLTQMATATGGLMMRNQNDLLAGLARVDSDLREFYTLVYQPSNTVYDGSFRNIKVELLKPGYHLRYRLGYWAIPPGQETMMTPAAAQLLAGVATGELRPAFAPQMNAVELLAANGQLAAPVHVSLPAKPVKFEKDPKQDLYEGGVTFLLAGRDRIGKLVTVHQRFLDLRLNKKQLNDFERQRLDISARLAVPGLEPLNLQAILQFSDGTVAIGEYNLAPQAPAASGSRLTNLLLTNRVEPSSGPFDTSDPLRGPNYQLYLPSQPRFSSSDKLTVYFGALDLPIDPATHRARLRLSFAIKQGATTAQQFPPEEAVGATGQKRLLVLKQFDLNSLRPGTYTFEVKAQDSAGSKALTQSSEFVIGQGRP